MSGLLEILWLQSRLAFEKQARSKGPIQKRIGELLGPKYHRFLRILPYDPLLQKAYLGRKFEKSAKFDPNSNLPSYSR